MEHGPQTMVFELCAALWLWVCASAGALGTAAASWGGGLWLRERSARRLPFRPRVASACLGTRPGKHKLTATRPMTCTRTRTLPLETSEPPVATDATRLPNRSDAARWSCCRRSAISCTLDASERNGGGAPAWPLRALHDAPVRMPESPSPPWATLLKRLWRRQRRSLTPAER